MTQDNERRQFKRLNAPVFCRPLGGAVAQDKRQVGDISLGGVRVFSDDEHRIGEHLELELFMPDGNSVTLDTHVVWVDPLEKGGPAKFEVGLRFVDIAKSDLDRLQSMLDE